MEVIEVSRLETNSIDEHSTIRINKNGLTTAQLIKEKKKDILLSWKDTVRAHAGRTFELMTSAQFDEEASVFLNEFAEAISSEEYENVSILEFERLRQLLREISVRRVKQGFTPSETATFIFSLKHALLEYLQDYFKDPNELNSEVVVIDKLIDTLGLYTFETYAKTREEIIREQARVISLLQEARAARALLKVDDGVVALPVMGAPEPEAQILITQSLLNYVAKHKCKVVAFDLTNISSFDRKTTNHLMRVMKAVKLIGAKPMLTGIKPDLATTIIGPEEKFKGISLFKTLKDGMRYASQLRDEYTEEKRVTTSTKTYIRRS
jgi:rsbT co-antagonist protein RsbR